MDDRDDGEKKREIDAPEEDDWVEWSLMEERNG